MRTTWCIEISSLPTVGNFSDSFLKPIVFIVLMGGESGDVPVLADFSLCKPFVNHADSDEQTHTPEIATCKYRAPEVLSQEGGYSAAVDNWWATPEDAV